MEVCPASRSVEVPPVPQEGLEELLRVQGEFVNGLVLARYLLGSGKELLPWNVEQDSHARMRYIVVVLEPLPPLRLEGSYSVVEAKTWLQLVQLPPNDDLPFPPLQPLLRTIAVLEHPRGLLYCYLRVPQDSALPRPPESRINFL